MVQEVFLVVWRRLPGFELRHEGSFPGWLFRIARNVVADRARRARRHSTAPLDSAPEASVEFEGGTLSQRVLVDALRTLPEAQREVVMLRFLLDLSLADVAAAVGKSEGAVVQLQLRGLHRLRREMGP